MRKIRKRKFNRQSKNRRYTMSKQGKEDRAEEKRKTPEIQNKRGVNRRIRNEGRKMERTRRRRRQ